jgi:hypothetical protein
MKNKTALLWILILLTIACNLPGAVATTSPFPAPTTAIPISTPAPTQTPLSSDLPFTIDCSALPESRKADCDSFIAATRDQVYPIFREVTGVSLSKCYKEIHYVILPTDPLSGAGGLSAGDTITYNQAYSIDLPHRYDVHELLHSISSCTGALDLHVFHGLVMNYVYDRLGVHDPGYFQDKLFEGTGPDSLPEKVKTASGQELSDSCKGILIDKVTNAFFDLGPSSAQPLYQSTIAPLEITTPPNPNLVTVWGTAAEQIESLLETMEQDFKYPVDVPECGY